MRVSESTLQRILTLYGRGFVSLERVMSGYRNHSHIVHCQTHETVNVIVYKSEPEIAERVKRINHLSGTISSSGLPVRYPLDSRVLAVSSGARRSAAGLYNYLPGETIPWEAYRRAHIKLLGMAMAGLHRAGDAFDGDLPLVIDEYQAIISRMRRYFEREDVRGAMAKKLFARLDVALFDRLAIFLEACRVLPTRVLHMDLVRSNVLFGRAEPESRLAVGKLAITGILDFEKASVGHPLFDVARTLAFLLVDCSFPPAKLQNYFIDSGYRKHGGSNLRPEMIAGRDMLGTLIDLFLLYDFYKFLRNTPYESLRENHHFVQTLAILRARKLLY